MRQPGLHRAGVQRCKGIKAQRHKGTEAQSRTAFSYGTRFSVCVFKEGGKLYRAIWIVSAALLLLFGGAGRSFAMDKDGCLTCHQYPGLARSVTSKEIKVFHIDEERYMKSPHGKLQCTQCHTTIHKVPHVGETAVTCTGECHQSEEDRKKVAAFDLKTMHSQEQSYITRLEDGSSCRVCHLLYPHHSSELARSFINMHVSFMTCEVCHIDRGKYPSLEYDWTSSETADFAGKPFGARFNPKLDDASGSTHFISRIAVFSVENGEKKPMLNTWDTQKATDYLAEEAKLTPAEKEAQLRYFHRDIHKTGISVTCNECHSKDSILDYRKLGFSEKRAADLVNINIKGLVTKYKVFYLPEMLEK